MYFVIHVFYDISCHPLSIRPYSWAAYSCGPIMYLLSNVIFDSSFHIKLTVFQSHSSDTQESDSRHTAWHCVASINWYGFVINRMWGHVIAMPCRKVTRDTRHDIAWRSLLGSKPYRYISALGLSSATQESDLWHTACHLEDLPVQQDAWPK